VGLREARLRSWRICSQKTGLRGRGCRGRGGVAEQTTLGQKRFKEEKSGVRGKKSKGKLSWTGEELLTPVLGERVRVLRHSRSRGRKSYRAGKGPKAKPLKRTGECSTHRLFGKVVMF